MLSPAMSPADLFVERPGYEETGHPQFPEQPRQELRFMLFMSVAIFLKEVLCGFDLRNRGLQGKVKEVTRGVGHNLFAKSAAAARC
uniref:Uncharacterized protein n=1 Tax=Klebsiella pneumoniae TaxID=573 RepID=A0A8B0SQH4_KLEPN|nr:hypothetical protein [Klebsiella pneumoniae]